MHSVTGCQFQDNGNRRVWFFRDNSQVVELLSVPLSCGSTITTRVTATFLIRGFRLI
jgi:hypothetical protein